MNPPLIATLGTDPELMLKDVSANRIVSSIPVLNHDKKDPIDLGDGIKAYSDNVLVEMAMPPEQSSYGLIQTLRKAFIRTQEKLGADYQLVPKASHVYDEDQLKAKAAIEAGCNPNYNAYTGEQNMPADFTSGLRSGSFHIHLGNPLWKQDIGKMLKKDSKNDTIKLLDIFVGCASILFDKDKSAPARRKLYGQAGEFRPTPYGVEYRVLGNYALRSPRLTELVFDLVNLAMIHLNDDTEKDLLKTIDPIMVRHAINNNSETIAAAVLKKAQVPKEIITRIRADISPNFYRDWKI